MKIVCEALNMFTRVPTFIPTSSDNETRNTNPRNVDKGIACSTAATPESRRRKRAKTIRKRLPTKKSEVNRNVYNQLPVINQNEVFREEHLPSPSYQRESRKSRISTLNSTVLRSPYLTRELQQRKRSEISSGRGEMDEQDLARNDMEHSDKGTDDTDMLTHARLHKRNRRKFHEHHDIQSKRHAKNYCANLEDGKITGSNKTNSTSRLQRHEVEGGKPFRSKIPVRFPEIQENERNLRTSKYPQTFTKPADVSLPPIYDGKNFGKANNSEKVTQSIQDCRNMLEKDFQRLGENLDNTFKLLHRYIEGTRTSAE